MGDVASVRPLLCTHSQGPSKTGRRTARHSAWGVRALGSCVLDSPCTRNISLADGSLPSPFRCQAGNCHR